MVRSLVGLHGCGAPSSGFRSVLWKAMSEFHGPDTLQAETRHPDTLVS